MVGSVLLFFTDPVLRAPTIGCMLMCLGAGLIGVVAFLRKQSLLGESLSHASYPGVILGVIFAGALALTEENDTGLSFFILTGAFVSSLLGLRLIELLVNKCQVKADAALCFILSIFFGIGLTLASHIQFTYTNLYKQVQAYLYGQAATMTDVNILIYGILSSVILFSILFYYKELQTITFDRVYAISLGIPVKALDSLVFLLIVLAVVIGIRSVGVVLMSAMLIAPASAARQFTNKFSVMLVLSGFFGVLSGFLGNYLSVEMTNLLANYYPTTRLALPTGPMIVIVASLICLLSLLLAPERGLFWRLVRIAGFRYRCMCENLLKTMWRYGPDEELTFHQIVYHQTASKLYLHLIISQLVFSGWVAKVSRHHYTLTSEGRMWAAKIVRLHRLWEVYLADYIGVGGERVHHNAEEMEHIITPELEQELTLLLKDPKQDPHHQPIPPKETL